MNEASGQKVMKKPEGIRSWYQRTTAKARKTLVWLTLIGISGATVMFFFAPQQFSERLQRFNGAMTIPIFGLIWIVGFIYLFLIPQREAGFRGQEWIEAGVSTMKASMDQKIVPAVGTWQKIGEQIEKEFPSMLGNVKDLLKKASETMDELKAAAKKLNDAVDRNEKIVEEVRPVIASLRRIETRIETEIAGGLFESVNIALETVRGMAGLPKSEEVLPDINFVMESMRRNKLKAGTR